MSYLEHTVNSWREGVLRVIRDILCCPKILFPEHTSIVDDMCWSRSSPAHRVEREDIIIQHRHWDIVLNGGHS